MRRPPSAPHILLAACLAATACDKPPKPTPQEEQAEAFTRAYVAVTQNRPPNMKALADAIGTRPAQCAIKDAACSCTWRFPTSAATKEILALGIPPAPFVVYSIQLRNKRTREDEDFSDVDAAVAALAQRKTHDLIDGEQYLVQGNIAKYGPDARLGWMSGADLRPTLFKDWYLASAEMLRIEKARQKYQGIDPVAAMSLCMTADIPVAMVQLDKDEPLIFRADF